MSNFNLQGERWESNQTSGFKKITCREVLKRRRATTELV